MGNSVESIKPNKFYPFFNVIIIMGEGGVGRRPDESNYYCCCCCCCCCCSCCCYCCQSSWWFCKQWRCTTEILKTYYKNNEKNIISLTLLATVYNDNTLLFTNVFAWRNCFIMWLRPVQYKNVIIICSANPIRIRDKSNNFRKICFLNIFLLIYNSLIITLRVVYNYIQ